jgi:hypothetical protein
MPDLLSDKYSVRRNAVLVGDPLHVTSLMNGLAVFIGRQIDP